MSTAMLRLYLRPRTAIVIPVPEAAGIVEVTDPGMPPHVTLLWPFARRPRARHRRGLAAIAARHSQFEFALTQVGTFPGVVYLAPDPAGPFVDLTRAIAEAWPRYQPYGGAYPNLIPHLTVRLGIDPLTDGERAELEAALPIRCHATEIMLLAPDGERWRELYRLPLPATSETW